MPNDLNSFPTASVSERGPCAGEDARDIEKCVRSGRVARPAVGPLPPPGSGNAGNPAGMTRAGDSPRRRKPQILWTARERTAVLAAYREGGIRAARAAANPQRGIRSVENMVYEARRQARVTRRVRAHDETIVMALRSGPKETPVLVTLTGMSTNGVECACRRLGAVATVRAVDGRRHRVTSWSFPT